MYSIAVCVVVLLVIAVVKERKGNESAVVSDCSGERAMKVRLLLVIAVVKGQ